MHPPFNECKTIFPMIVDSFMSIIFIIYMGNTVTIQLIQLYVELTFVVTSHCNYPKSWFKYYLPTTRILPTFFIQHTYACNDVLHDCLISPTLEIPHY